MGARKTYETTLIPPLGELGPEEAIRWLRVEYPKYHFAVHTMIGADGVHWHDPAALLQNLGVMVEACARSLTTGKPVGVEWHDSELSNPAHLPRLERLIAFVEGPLPRKFAGLPARFSRALRARKRIAAATSD